MLIVNELVIVVPYFIRRWLIGRAQVSQVKMDYYYDPPPFDVAKRYTYLVSSATIVAVFAPASPVLYFNGAFWLVMMMFVQKLLVCEVYCRPKLIDDEVAEASREYLGYLLQLHVCFSAIFYLVAGHGTHSGEDVTMAWPFYAAAATGLVYAIFPFGLLISRVRRGKRGFGHGREVVRGCEGRAVVVDNGGWRKLGAFQRGSIGRISPRLCGAKDGRSGLRADEGPPERPTGLCAVETQGDAAEEAERAATLLPRRLLQ